MTTIFQKIEEAIKEPQKQLTRSEAVELLKQYGVLNSDGEIEAAYRDILKKKKEKIKPKGDF